MARYISISEIPNYEQFRENAEKTAEWLSNLRYHWMCYCAKKHIWFSHFKILPPSTNLEYNGYSVDFYPECKKNNLFQSWFEGFLRKGKGVIPFKTIYYCNPKNGVGEYYHIEINGEENEILPYNHPKENC